ncbi:MAG: SufD family Fe-S cluster assembly protein [Thermoprotei archaeon]
MKLLISEVEKALEKPAPYGPDIDLSKYRIDEPGIDVLERASIGEKEVRAASRVGFSPNNVMYFQVDETALYRALEKTLSNYGVRMIPLKKALEELDIAKKLAWRLVDPRIDKYTASAYLYGGEIGYFVYVPPRVKVPIPIYTCLAITGDNKIQYAHNIVYIDEGGEAHIVTGCAVPHGIKGGVHIGISEFYVGRNARLTFTMIHAWSEGLHVRPRTAVYVNEGGEYVSYYVIYSPIASLQTYPRVELEANARAYLASIVAGSGNGVYDVGSKAVLNGKHSGAEIISRVIATNESKVYARAELIANETNTKGHIECLGLLLSDKASISSIPVITSNKQGALLSHEAAIGMIADKEIEYLMSKGFTEDEAKSVIIRGFMSIEAPGIPQTIKTEINRVLDLVTKYAVG